MALISLFAGVAALIVETSDRVSGTLTAPVVGGLTDTSVELLQSLVSEASADMLRLLAFERTVKLFLLKESLKKGRDGLDSLVLECFAT